MPQNRENSLLLDQAKAQHRSKKTTGYEQFRICDFLHLFRIPRIFRQGDGSESILIYMDQHFLRPADPHRNLLWIKYGGRKSWTLDFSVSILSLVVGEVWRTEGWTLDFPSIFIPSCVVGEAWRTEEWTLDFPLYLSLPVLRVKYE
jgi:hypothetical protein